MKYLITIICLLFCQSVLAQLPSASEVKKATDAVVKANLEAETTCILDKVSNAVSSAVASGAYKTCVEVTCNSTAACDTTIKKLKNLGYDAKILPSQRSILLREGFYGYIYQDWYPPKYGYTTVWYIHVKWN